MKTNTQAIIIQYIRKKQNMRPHDLQKILRISRVAVHKQLSKLLTQGVIEKHGFSPKVTYSLVRPTQKKHNPHYLWDYDYDKLKKTEQGRIKILERMINYGPGEGEKIPLSQVKKYWDKLDLYTNNKRLMELLIWGKYRTSRPNKPVFSIK